MTTKMRRPGRAGFRGAVALGVMVAAGWVAPAGAMVGGQYDPDRAPIATTWFRLADPAAMRADREYVSGMRRHHAGALTMSEAYLADPAAESPVLKALARAIIPNQRFEIGLLDEVARNLDQAPVEVNLGLFRLELQPAATEGMAELQRFLRVPAPVAGGGLAARGQAVSVRDVQFAKAMVVHHQGALEMARAYNADPAGRNGFLRLLNVDIIADQSQEIALMQAVVAAYRGDASAIPVEPGMVHGMDHGPGHGMDHSGHGGMAMPEAAPVVAPVAAPERRGVPRRVVPRRVVPRRVAPGHEGHHH